MYAELCKNVWDTSDAISRNEATANKNAFIEISKVLEDLYRRQDKTSLHKEIFSLWLTAR